MHKDLILHQDLIYSLFEQTAETFPERIAVEQGDRQLTYAALNEAADGIADHLHALGCERQDLVATLEPHGIEYVIAMLGTLKAHGLWVPLDRTFPQRRLGLMLSKTRPRFILVSESRHSELCTLLDGEALSAPEAILPFSYCIEQGLSPAGPPNDRPAIPADADTGDDSCYLMFTSGSSGEPKGIEGRQCGLSHFIRWEIEEFGLDEHVRVSLLAPPTFDVSLRDLFVPLVAGGTVCIPDPETRNDPVRLLRWLHDSKVNLCHLVPSLFRQLIRELKKSPDPEPLPHLQKLALAGEPLLAADVLQWMDLVGDRIELINLYGPSETTLAKVFHRIRERPEQAHKIMPIGKPISHTAILILQGDRLCPIGKIGEIHIKTPFRSKGYFRQPEMTAQVFVPNPLTNDPDDLLYKSGDLGRYLPDRSIEYVGRMDRQVKVNGIRIEPAEIEVALRRHPAVDQAVVVPYQNAERETLPACYYTLEEGFQDFDPRQAHDHLSLYLPRNMMPAFYTRLDEMPLNLNGKVDRKALPKPEELIYAEGGFEPPANALETRIADIWKKRLGLSKVGVNTPFFTLGGHSLIATKIVADLCGSSVGNLSLKDFFEHPTVRELAAHLSSRAPQARLQPIARRAEGNDGPLSPVQRRFWVMEQMVGGPGAYNIPAAFQIFGNLSIDALKRSLARLSERHESLRTSFPSVDGEPLQRIDDQMPLPFSIIDLGHLPADEPQEQIALLQLSRRHAKTTFNLSRGPLWRVTLARLADAPSHNGAESAGRFLLLFNIHHIVADAWSLDVCLRELARLYEAHTRGAEPDLPELRIQYRDYAYHQLEKGDEDASASFWRRCLRDLKRLDLTTDRPRPRLKNYSGAVARLTVPESLAKPLKAFAAERGARPFQVLATLFNVFLHRHQNRRAASADIAMGTPVTGRFDPDLEHQVGCYLNLVVLRNRFHDQQSFEQLLDQVCKEFDQVLEHQEFPFDRLVHELDGERSPSRSPLFDVMIDFQQEIALQLGDLRIEEIPSSAGTSKYDLTLQVVQGSGDRLFIDFEYDTQLFDESTVRNFLDRFLCLMHGALADPTLPISQLPMINNAELESMTAIRPARTWAAGLPTCREPTVLDIFDQRATQHPGATAMVYGDARITYGELQRVSRQIAARLIGLGAGHGDQDPIGLLATRSPNTVAAFLGIMRIGAPVLPLDPNQPAARSALMAAGLKVVCDAEAADRVATFAEPVPSPWLASPHLSTESTSTESTPRPGVDSLAYILHTSGSTGKPKGVEIRHGSLAAYLAWAEHTYAPTDPPGTAHMPLFTALTFDLTLTSLFLPLMRGDTVHLIDHGSVEQDLRAIFEPGSPVDLVKLTPTHVRLLPHLGLNHTNVGRVVVGGEALEARHIQILQGLNANIQIFNEYGPTEATVGCIAGRVDRPGDIHIGEPIDGAQALVLDVSSQLCPIGVAGEICIAGAGLASGYRDLPEQTANKFVTHPLAAEQRLYRTGDLGRRRPDGKLEYLGRVDDQIKIRGYRVEPGEVEEALLSHPGVQEAVVGSARRPAADAADFEDVDPQLVAWIVADKDSPPTLDLLQRHLCSCLPDWMLPDPMVFVDALPVGPHGKLDRCALPTPFADIDFPESPEPADPHDSVEGEWVQGDSAVEKTIHNIWCRVLGVEEVGPDDRFFDLGGHSLKAIQVLSAIEKRLGARLNLSHLFLQPTVRGLTGLVHERLLEGRRDEQIEPAAEAASYPLSPAQRPVWLSQQMHPGTTVFHVPGGLVLEGDLDIDTLEHAFQQLIRRHESLRTTFKQEGGEPRQVIRDLERASTFRLQRLLGGNPPDETTMLRALLTRLAEQPFDLEHGPLIRAQIVHLKPKSGRERIALLVVIHHLISDAWSIGVMVRDLVALYQTRVQDHPADPEPEEGHLLASPNCLDPLVIQYKDYAVDLCRRLERGDFETSRRYWLRVLEGRRSTLDLPTDFPRSARRGFEGKRLPLELDESRCNALHRLARLGDATPFVLLLSLVKVLLVKITGDVHQTVGTPIVGREAPGLENQIGFFVNVLPLVDEIDPESTLSEVFAQVKNTVVQAFAHREIAFDELASEFRPEFREPGRAPLFDIQVSLDNTDQQSALRSIGVELGWSVEILDHDLGGSKLDLSFAFLQDGWQLEGYVDFNTSIFKAQTVDAWARQFETLLDIAETGLHRTLIDLFPRLADESEQLQVETLTAAALTQISEDF